MEYSDLLESVKTAAALRLRLRLQPLYGEGATVFPPTYPNGPYLIYDRRVRDADGDFQSLPCAILDSVQSQANRMEEALLDDIRAGAIDIPHIASDFSGVSDLVKPVGKITSLEAPHRAFDAILRDSVTSDGAAFPLSEAGQAIRKSSIRDATALFQYDPCSLVFGAWDSTGPSGGLGEKFTRCVVSEITAINVCQGERQGLRCDPLNISALVEVAADPNTRIISEVGAMKKSVKENKKRASEANHSNVPWGRDNLQHGGVTMDYAEQSATVSLPAIRRLRFPVDGKVDPDLDAAAHAVLAAMCIHGIALCHERGYHLRSRCDLIPEDGTLPWEKLVASSSGEPIGQVTAELTRSLLGKAVEAAESAGLDWQSGALELVPGEALSKLVVKSQKAQAEKGEDAS